MKNKVKFLVCYAAIILLAQACTDKNRDVIHLPVITDSIPVKTIPLQLLGSTTTVNTFGHLTTDDETILSFKMGGVVKSVLVKEGDQVNAGQLLATLDLTDNNFQQEQLMNSYEKAERDLKRYKNLFRDSAATLEQVQNAQTTFQLFSAQLKALKFNRNFSEIRASVKGYVISRYVNPGQIVSGSEHVLLTNGALHNKWLLKASVNDVNWVAISLNDIATIKVDAFPDKIFKAKVCSKSEASDPSTGTFTIKLEVNNEGMKFATGMFASASINNNKQQAYWNLPYESVLDAGNDQGFVFTTNDNQVVTKQMVTIASFDADGIKISKGLENAKAVIVSGSAYLTDRSPIKIFK
jgi:RND family efflux transporter MFP subunit